MRSETILWARKKPFMAWCSLHDAQRDDMSPFGTWLLKRGRNFANSYAKTIGEPITAKDASHALALMKEGAGVILQAPLSADGIDVKADVLVRKETHKSVFGKWHYVVHEVTTAKSPGEQHLLRMALCHRAISQVQEYEPKHCYIVWREEGPRSEKVVAAVYLAELDAAIEAAHSLEKSPMPHPDLKSVEEPYKSYCKKMAAEMDDISQVANVGSDRQAFLRAAGIDTTAKLAVAESVPEIADTKLEQIRQCAVAFREKKFIVLRDINVPSADVELYIDLEGAELESGHHDAVCGILMVEKGKGTFHVFTAKSPAESEKLASDAIAFLKKWPDAPIFHYAPREKDVLKRWAGDDAKSITKRMTDILQVMKRCVAPPTTTYSLKDIAGALGHKWKGVSDATDAMALFHEYVETADEALIDKIIEYNEDDCRALYLVKKWVSGNSHKTL